MLIKLLKIIFILIIYFPAIDVCAQSKLIEISDEDKYLDLIHEVEVYTQPKNNPSFEEARNFTFKENSTNLFLDYYNDLNLWVRFKVKNSCSRERKFILEVPNATISKLILYKEVFPGQYEQKATGTSYTFSSRDIKSRYFTFDIEIPPGETRNYYININTEGDAMNFPLILWKTIPYLNKTANGRYFLGIYYGSILFIIIFHLFLYYKFRDKALIFYMLYVAGFAGYQLYMDGFASKYVFPDFPTLARRSVAMFAYLCFWSMIIFTQLYLNTKRLIPSFNKVLNVFKWILFSGLILCLLNYEIYLIMQHLLNYLGPISTLMVIIGAVLSYRQEPVLSKYLIFAFSFLIGGILLEVTRNTGFNYNSDYGLKIGHAIEAVILAFALAVRFKQNNDKIQTLALERLKNLNQLKDQYNAELEKTVSLRTAELNISNQNLNDSILYARHIQHSLLPSKCILEDYIPDHFIFIKPKEIISGDFYWFEKIGDKLIIAVVDCTGHGVPGAFMSMLGSTILRQTIKINKITDPEQILKIMDCEIRSTLKQSHEDPYNKDGMDLSLIVYDTKNFKVQFAGAKRPLIHINEDKEMVVYKGSKYSIGGDFLNFHIDKTFSSTCIPLRKGDSLYLFTDGILDQFGGEHNKKFMMNKFKEVLFQVQELKMELQGKKLEEILNDWRGKLEQVDDILVIGLKF